VPLLAPDVPLPLLPPKPEVGEPDEPLLPVCPLEDPVLPEDPLVPPKPEEPPLDADDPLPCEPCVLPCPTPRPLLVPEEDPP